MLNQRSHHLRVTLKQCFEDVEGHSLVQWSEEDEGSSHSIPMGRVFLEMRHTRVSVLTYIWGKTKLESSLIILSVYNARRSIERP